MECKVEKLNMDFFFLSQKENLVCAKGKIFKKGLI